MWCIFYDSVTHCNVTFAESHFQTNLLEFLKQSIPNNLELTELNPNWSVLYYRNLEKCFLLMISEQYTNESISVVTTITRMRRAENMFSMYDLHRVYSFRATYAHHLYSHVNHLPMLTICHNGKTVICLWCTLYYQ